MTPLIITLLVTNYFPSCEYTIINSIKSYKIENGFTCYELFNDIDCNNDECIDYYEIKTFMIKVGIPWRCHWPNKVIEYFSEQSEAKNETETQCIQWSSFRSKIRNNK